MEQVHNVSVYAHASPGTEVIKKFSCSTQLSMTFQMLIKSKMLKIKTFLAFKLSDSVFIMLIDSFTNKNPLRWRFAAGPIVPPLNVYWRNVFI